MLYEVITMVDEGAALVGVEFEGKASAQNGFLEAVQKGGRVRRRMVSGEGNEPAVIVEQHAELGGDCFATGTSQGDAAGEVSYNFV